jgi:hypothetical protein
MMFFRIPALQSGWSRLFAMVAVAIPFFADGVLASADEPPLAVYAFDSDESTFKDSSTRGKPIDLRMDHPGRVRFSKGSAVFTGTIKATSDGPPRELMRAIQRRRELSVEVWLTPADLRQSGPARIVTLSSDPSNRNFTIGQDGDRFDVRLRTTKTSRNGLPSLASPKQSVTREPTHLVFTRSRNGTTRLFLDGEQVARGHAGGSFENWDLSMRLAVGDEVSGGRPWKGKLDHVAIYDHALTPKTIASRFRSGPSAWTEPAASPEELARENFEQQIAPLLANRCLECHDAASAKGGVVLDRRDPAFESVIVAGDAESSPLWESVSTDRMPHGRPPLLAEEKQLLKEWIASGATWSLEWIDPADYVQNSGASQNYVRRLTIDEYIRSVKAAVGVDCETEARKRLPVDPRADGFRNTAYNLTVDLKHIDAYSSLARWIVGQMDVRGYAKQYWGQARLTDKDTRGLIQKMGAWILRGPLLESEVDLFRGISTTVAASGGDYEDAVGAVIEAMLQSPRFLYRMETQNVDGSVEYLDEYQLASRISYLVWGAPPDESLRAAASDGSLRDPETVRRQIERMLYDERARRRSHDFVVQWLNLGHVDSLRPDEHRFPNWDSELAADMQRETLAFFDHVVWEQKRPLAELLNAQVTYCSPRLAEHYGMKSQGDGWQSYDLRNVAGRGGLLTQGSVLTIGGDDASMVTRGLFVLKQLLRGVVNDPPPCVDTTPVPTEPGLSARSIAQSRIKNEACGGCHKRFEPLAFGLEKFDGLGTWHDVDEHGNQLREDGRILFPGAAEPTAFDTTAELMDLLAGSDRVRESLVWKLTQFAAGRPLTADDAPVVRDIYQRSRRDGETYQAILAAIATSPIVMPGQ